MTGKRASTTCALALLALLGAERAAPVVADDPVSAELRAPEAPVTLRVVVVSDLNGRYGSTEYDDEVHAAVRRIRELRPDVVLSTGDMVAGQRRGLDYRAMWAGFHAAVSDPLAAAGIPFAVTPGNHDASGYRYFANERAVFVEEWEPARKPALDYLDDSEFPLRYSFTMGPALFVSLDATTVGPIGRAQKRWLERQLVAGRDRPVKILFSHVPLYPFAQGRETEAQQDPDLEALLERHGVTLYVSGHHHAYYPGRRGPLRLVSSSCLGSGPRKLIGDERLARRSFIALEIGADGIRELDAFAGEAFDEAIARDTLPERVGVGDAIIVRDDL